MKLLYWIGGIVQRIIEACNPRHFTGNEETKKIIEEYNELKRKGEIEASKDKEVNKETHT